MRLQTIRNRTIRNHTAAGKSLSRFLKSKAAMSIVLEKWNCGWLDGGCWTLASAFVRWTHPESTLRHVYDTFTQQSQHAVCHLPTLDVYIDGDGICTEAEMLDKMRILEDYDSPLAIRNATKPDNDPKDIWEETTRLITELLTGTFGPWHTSTLRKDLHKRMLHANAPRQGPTATPTRQTPRNLKYTTMERNPNNARAHEPQPRTTR